MKNLTSKPRALKYCLELLDSEKKISLSPDMSPVFFNQKI